MPYHWVPGEEVTADKLNRTEGGLENATITYDVDDRISTITDPDSGIVYTLTYDADDQVATVSDGTHTYTLAYNGDDNLISITKT